ncbi:MULTISPECIES: hypothetical protein [unclassified Leclercia]|uniref:Uncharacterized protein n=1 Tax=Leclercia barmai TaxID=2785629 RepID=A0ABS7RT84_9ENTR|nr:MULTISPECIES: hypothetical protein [unclassified Leclercia]MBZ0057522.1 hypothetical protein [Leclercia sp. EMC7]MCM5695683.1 hypothetical protein [Leclercia sp. LTM01]MCM5700092.1 hypothetical protein [Leclercia sp. LTM14]
MKNMIITLILATIAATPVQAMNAQYRQQLKRSGCTEMNAGNTCNLNKTPAQNAAAEKRSKVFTRFTGTYSIFSSNGQRLGNKAIRVQPREVRYEGQLVERARVINGVLLFSVDQAQYSITDTYGRVLGRWFDDRTNTGGTIGR